VVCSGHQIEIDFFLTALKATTNIDQWALSGTVAILKPFFVTTILIFLSSLSAAGDPAWWNIISAVQ
jgi:hypothetical protein